MPETIDFDPKQQLRDRLQFLRQDNDGLRLENQIVRARNEQLTDRQQRLVRAVWVLAGGWLLMLLALAGVLWEGHR